MMNIVMLGYYTEFRGYSPDNMLQLVKENVPEKSIEGNIKAYELGTTIDRSELTAI